MTGMKLRMLVIGIAATSVVTACGSDTISRSALASSIVARAKKDGQVIEAGCVKSALSKLNDADLKVMDTAIRKDAGPTGLSTGGEEVMLEIVACAGSIGGVSVPAATEGLSAVQNLMLDQLAKQFEGQGYTVDKPCLTELMKGLTLDQIKDPASPALTKLTTDALACIKK